MTFKSKRMAAVALAASCLMSAGMGVASAADTPAATVSASASTGNTALDNYLATLSPQARQDFINTKLPATVSGTKGPQVPADPTAAASLDAAAASGAVITPMATGCWTQKYTWGPKAAAGNTLYTFFTVGRWCSSGSTVTSASLADAGGETKTIGWRYEGVTGKGAGVVGNQGRSWARHRFVLGAGGVDVQTPIGCGRAKGASSGSASFDQVCSIY